MQPSSPLEWVDREPIPLEYVEFIFLLFQPPFLKLGEEGKLFHFLATSLSFEMGSQTSFKLNLLQNSMTWPKVKLCTFEKANLMYK